MDAITEHYEALKARDRAGDPLTLEFMDFMHAASLRRMTASWLARPDHEDRMAATEQHRDRMEELRKRIHGIRDASPTNDFAVEYYVANAQRILDDVRASKTPPIDPFVD
jgi:hypothetical protein